MSATLSGDPLDTLISAVASLEVFFGKKNLTVWRVQGERVSPVYGLLDPDGRQNALVRRLWRRQVDELRAGHSVRAEGSTLLPLVGEELVGLVYVAGETHRVAPRNLPMVRVALTCLAEAMVQPSGPSDADILASAGALAATPATTTLAQVDAEASAAAGRMQAAERRKLVSYLETNDWNVSETARQLGWSRSKALQRMEAYGIQRPSPAPTDPRRLRGAADASTDVQDELALKVV